MIIRTRLIRSYPLKAGQSQVGHRPTLGAGTGRRPLIRLIREAAGQDVTITGRVQDADISVVASFASSAVNSVMGGEHSVPLQT